MGDIVHGGYCPWGDIVQGEVQGGMLYGAMLSKGGCCPGGGGACCLGDDVQGGMMSGGSYPGGSCLGDIVPGDIVRGDIVLSPYASKPEIYGLRNPGLCPPTLVYGTLGGRQHHTISPFRFPRARQAQRGNNLALSFKVISPA